jgi:competence protein ComEA
MLRLVSSMIATASLLALTASTAAAQTAPSKAPIQQTAVKASTAVVNINTASAAELDVLPGIGAKTAARIVEYRQKNGPFKKVEELMNVRGVGEKNFLKLKAQISVGAAKTEPDRPNQ